MRINLLCILLFLIASGLRGQEVTLLGPQFDYTYAGETYHPGVGIDVEGMFGKRLSLNYSALYGPIAIDRYYFYAGGGQALGVYLINKSIEERSGIALGITLGILSFIIPESLTLRIAVSNTSQVGIFLAPYGYELIKNTATVEADERTSYELGLKYYLSATDWLYFIPRIGMKGFYGERSLGASFGVSVLFKVKEE